MPTERLLMRKTKEILRLKYEVGLAHRAIARSLSVSVGVVGMTSSRAQTARLTWEEAKQLSEEEIEARLYTKVALEPGQERPMPDFAHVHTERLKVGVTLQLLHVEYGRNTRKATATPSSASTTSAGLTSGA